ncbi:hypothetical protein EV356DRAFT_153441 [Viridothelium virens]|uniref:Uncharacterized protein n=1 Tax=Viridothelium virens TaxID=1048519 RepID=A0A6A6HAH5_VIRVR|nr:hypothetical protein EV356DRAFT_153441 [Viridothelium virens]
MDMRRATSSNLSFFCLVQTARLDSDIAVCTPRMHRSSVCDFIGEAEMLAKSFTDSIERRSSRCSEYLPRTNVSPHKMYSSPSGLQCRLGPQHVALLAAHWTGRPSPKSALKDGRISQPD